MLLVKGRCYRVNQRSSGLSVHGRCPDTIDGLRCLKGPPRVVGNDTNAPRNLNDFKHAAHGHSGLGIK